MATKRDAALQHTDHRIVSAMSVALRDQVYDDVSDYSELVEANVMREISISRN